MIVYLGSTSRYIALECIKQTILLVFGYKVTSESITPVVNDSSPQCAVGRSQCDIIDELEALRKEVGVLSELVRTDTLTGLFNYRHFIQALAMEMERTRRTEQPTALIMVDLDYFKQVNDQWGHDTGNRALIATAQILRQSTRKLDIPCRYGGEEFAVILPSVDRITGSQVAERIRAAIEAEPLLIDDKDIGLTASLGVALYGNGEKETPEDFVKRADRYLYQAKNSGRNCVCNEVQDLEDADVTVSEAEKEALFDMFADDKT